MTASDHVRVVLDSVQTKLTGSYLCEVTVTPTFFALAEAANMTVIGKLERNISNWIISTIKQPPTLLIRDALMMEGDNMLFSIFQLLIWSSLFLSMTIEKTYLTLWSPQKETLNRPQSGTSFFLQIEGVSNFGEQSKVVSWSKYNVMFPVHPPEDSKFYH